ncbi:hypothetical protein ILUMI_22702 [Ignelater luminosus]|uniref:Protein LLP homolog n=1 Tax=Ignelater luminosus TaxID=2038154 RepID=A0A8K0C9K7_IGNLU|nr:hypothetical protein ILUMI_22702 [Ignelater luminosus]
MAKSIRSKWKRKCRAVKRERYNKKELELLKKTLSNDPCNKPSDIDMTDVNEIATVVDKQTIKKKKQRKASTSVTHDDADEDEMVMDTNAKQRIFNPKTMKDQHGTYPVWMHPRKIHKRKKAGKGKLKKKGKSK